MKLRPPDGVIALLAALERQHGQARLLVGPVPDRPADRVHAAGATGPSAGAEILPAGWRP